ncbi:MAG: hypothetical protein AAFN77_12535 [Planctomycetota bacterium]
MSQYFRFKENSTPSHPLRPSRPRAGKTLLKFVALGIITTLLAQPALAQQNQQSDAADYFPDSTAIYVHVRKPGELVDRIENHSAVKRAMELPQAQEFFESPQFAMAQIAQKLLEGQLEEPILETIKENTAKGMWIGFDTETNGVMLVFRADDEDRLKRVAGQLLKFIGTAAQQQGNNVEIKKREYRDAVAAKVGDALIARYKDWFLVSNKPDFAKSFVDNLIDKTDDTLANQTWFQEQLTNRTNADVWATIDLETARSLSKNEELFSGKTNNPGAELILGGIFDLLKNSPSVTAELNLKQDIELTVRAPFDQDWMNESREYFYGDKISGRAPLSLLPKNTIANLTSYRDVGLWWLSKEELYAENVIAQLAQTDSQLSTIFSGMDFGQDVLGSLQPGVQIVVTENAYQGENVPDVKVPAFALVGKLKDPDKLQRKLKIAFQSVIGFANINLGMNGQPQLDVETEKIDGTKLTTASYFIEEGTEEGLLLFNFAPTIAFAGEDLVISSNRELAVELATLLKQQSGNPTEAANTKMMLDGKMLHQILQDNIESLIAQNMLEEGNDRDAASAEIQLLLSIVKLFRDAKAEYKVEPEQMKLDVQIRINE